MQIRQLGFLAAGISAGFSHFRNATQIQIQNNLRRWASRCEGAIAKFDVIKEIDNN